MRRQSGAQAGGLENSSETSHVRTHRLGGRRLDCEGPPTPHRFCFSIRPSVRGPARVPFPPNFAEVVPNLQSGGRGRVARLARVIQAAVLEAVRAGLCIQVMPRLTEGLVAFFSERVAS